MATSPAPASSRCSDPSQATSIVTAYALEPRSRGAGAAMSGHSPWSPARKWSVWASCAHGCGGVQVARGGATLCGHSPKSGTKAQKHLKLPRLEVIWGAKLLAARLTWVLCLAPSELMRPWWPLKETRAQVPGLGLALDGSVAALFLHRRFFSHEMPQFPHGSKRPIQEKLNPVQAHSPTLLPPTVHSPGSPGDRASEDPQHRPPMHFPPPAPDLPGVGCSASAPRQLPSGLRPVMLHLASVWKHDQPL